MRSLGLKLLLWTCLALTGCVKDGLDDDVRDAGPARDGAIAR